MLDSKGFGMKPPAISTAPWLLAALLTPLWFSGCSPTATYGTGEAPEMALFREVTGGIMGRRKKEPIEYQPRAPLVLPPTAEQLPPPVETAAIASPDWPVDPNQSVAGNRSKPPELPGSTDLRYGAAQAEYRRLKPLVGVLPGAHAPMPRDERMATYDLIIGGKQQREAFEKAIADAKGHDRERRFLTDPPEEYREPAATAPAEFEDINASGKGGGWLKWLHRN
jgi:hypothetical protein